MSKPLLALSAAAFLLLAGTAAKAGQTDEMFEIRASATAQTLALGQRGTVQIKLKMRKGAHISAEAPLKVSLTAKNIKIEKVKLGRTDAEHQADGPLFIVPIAGEAPGPASLEADLVFFVCTDKVCERQARKVSTSVTVRE